MCTMSVLVGAAALATAIGAAISLIIKTLTLSRCTIVKCGPIECVRKVPPVSLEEIFEP